MPEPLQIALLLGGPSAEREVSLASGAAMAGALRGVGHQVREVDPQTSDWALPSGTEVVCLALHGTYGEDGTVQERLEALGVPYTGCDAAASRLAFDKARAKECFARAGVPTPRWLVLDRPPAAWPDGWTLPVVVKPLCQGSSVGLRFVERAADLGAAVEAALRCDDRALVETLVSGRETTVGILERAALPVVEIRPRAGRYDYRNKYTRGATDYFCPADFDPATTERIQAAGRAAFEAVGGRDYGRVDVLVDGDGAPWVLEVNTLPGMTETSLLPKAAAAAGLGFAELCQKMVDLALARRARSGASNPKGGR